MISVLIIYVCRLLFGSNFPYVLLIGQEGISGESFKQLDCHNLTNSRGFFAFFSELQ